MVKYLCDIFTTEKERNCLAKLSSTYFDMFGWCGLIGKAGRIDRGFTVHGSCKVKYDALGRKLGMSAADIIKLRLREEVSKGAYISDLEFNQAINSDSFMEIAGIGIAAFGNDWLGLSDSDDKKYSLMRSIASDDMDDDEVALLCKLVYPGVGYKEVNVLDYMSGFLAYAYLHDMLVNKCRENENDVLTALRDKTDETLYISGMYFTFVACMRYALHNLKLNEIFGIDHFVSSLNFYDYYARRLGQSEAYITVMTWEYIMRLVSSKPRYLYPALKFEHDVYWPARLGLLGNERIAGKFKCTDVVISSKNGLDSVCKDRRALNKCEWNNALDIRSINTVYSMESLRYINDQLKFFTDLGYASLYGGTSVLAKMLENTFLYALFASEDYYNARVEAVCSDGVGDGYEYYKQNLILYIHTSCYVSYLRKLGCELRFLFREENVAESLLLYVDNADDYAFVKQCGKEASVTFGESRRNKIVMLDKSKTMGGSELYWQGTEKEMSLTEWFSGALRFTLFYFIVAEMLDKKFNTSVVARQYVYTLCTRFHSFDGDTVKCLWGASMVDTGPMELRLTKFGIGSSIADNNGAKVYAIYVPFDADDYGRNIMEPLLRYDDAMSIPLSWQEFADYCTSYKDVYDAVDALSMQEVYESLCWRF